MGNPQFDYTPVFMQCSKLRLYTHATQKALLEAHEKAFAYFGGVFRALRYDNMSWVVKKILRGYMRRLGQRVLESTVELRHPASSHR